MKCPICSNPMHQLNFRGKIREQCSACGYHDEYHEDDKPKTSTTLIITWLIFLAIILGTLWIAGSHYLFTILK